MEEDILYTDYGIKITSKKFYYEGKAYPLRKIHRINLKRVAPHKYVGLLLFVFGLAAILAGAMDVAGTTNIHIAESYYTINLDLLCTAIGVVVTLIAIIRIMIAKDEFVVKVRSKDGNEQYLNAKDRKYAARLIATLKRAYYRQNTKQGTRLLVDA